MGKLEQSLQIWIYYRVQHTISVYDSLIIGKGIAKSVFTLLNNATIPCNPSITCLSGLFWLWRYNCTSFSTNFVVHRVTRYSTYVARVVHLVYHILTRRRQRTTNLMSFLQSFLFSIRMHVPLALIALKSGRRKGSVPLARHIQLCDVDNECLIIPPLQDGNNQAFLFKKGR